MLLMHAFAALRDELSPGTLIAAYIDHGLRPAETPAEAAFVIEQAGLLGIKGVSCQIVLPEDGLGSIQDDARQARRAALETITDEYNLRWIATAHHADDQVETLLLRLIRGTTPRGLAGIHPVRGRWIHPLLPFSRACLTSLCEAQEIHWIEDPSNATLKYTRNQIRHSLLPLLTSAYHPQVKHGLLQLAEQARMDHAYWQEQLDIHCQAPAVMSFEGGCMLEVSNWSEWHQALQWRVLRALVSQVKGGDVETHHLKEMDALCRDIQGEKTLHLSGNIVCTRCYDVLFLYREGVLSPGWDTDEAIDFSLPSLGDILTLQTVWGELRIEKTKMMEEAMVMCDDAWSVCLAEQQMSSEQGAVWSLRGRRAGDRLLYTDGVSRHMKRWMIKRKIPKMLRGGLAMIDAGEGVTWIPGWHIGGALKERGQGPGWVFRFVPRDETLTQVARVWLNRQRKKGKKKTPVAT